MDMFSWFRYDIIISYWPLFMQGLWMTIKITVLGVTLGSILGLAIGLSRLAEAKHGWMKYALKFFVRWPSTIYVTFFRGTPLFVQILLIHFALMPLLIHPETGWLIAGETARFLKQEHGAFISGSLALILNAAAYISEIFRAGIQSLDRGQSEASRSLGLSYTQTMRYVIIPQAFRRMLPPLGNEAIMLLKDSSLVSAIGLAEIAYAARSVAGTYSRYWEPYITISLMYLIMTMGLSWIVSRLEEKYGSGH